MGAIKMTWKSSCRIELYSQVKYHSAFGKSCPLKRRVTAPRPRELYSLGGHCLTLQGTWFSAQESEMCLGKM